MSKVSNLDEFFGLLFKAIVADKSIPRCLAFIKRLLQLCYVNEANFAAATLLITSEIFRVRDDIRIHLYGVKQSDVSSSKVGQSKNSASNKAQVKLDQAESDEDEEVFVDVDKIQED